MRKKILLMVPMLHQGGFERVCVVTARLLDPYFDVYISIFDSKDIAYDIKGLNVIDLHLGVKEDLIGKCLNVVRRSIAVYKLKRKLKVDIAYSFGPSANIVNVFSRGKEKIWVGIRSYMDMGNEKKIRMLCKRADQVLCCSKTIEMEVKKKFKSKNALTLYNPLDIVSLTTRAGEEEPRIPWENREHVIASMGREDDVKGYWHLLKSFYLVRKKIPDAKLLIVGDGDFEEYRLLASNLQLGDAVYFTGLKKNPFPYLQAAKLYVLSSYYEGFPNALLEAMAFGLPVIATDCKTGPREILLDNYESAALGLQDSCSDVIYGEYGILVPNMSKVKDLNPSNITGEEVVLSEEIIRLLNDETIYQKYSDAAKQRAGNFSDQSYVDHMKALMET